MVSFKTFAVVALSTLASAQVLPVDDGLIKTRESLIRPTVIKTFLTLSTVRPSPTTTICEKPHMSTLCPRLCVATSTLPAPIHLCPTSYQYCPPATTSTVYRSCSWCPVARCATIHTEFAISQCPRPASCEPVATVTKRCQYTEWPEDAHY